MKKKLMIFSILSCFAITSCIFQEELGHKCGFNQEHPGPIEEAPKEIVIE